MANCVTVDPKNGVLSLDTVMPVDQCAYVLLQQGEQSTVANLTILFDNYFAFDAVLWGIIVTACLVTFATGHTLGRMMQAWRKVM